MKQTNDNRLQVRIPDDMRRHIDRLAEQEHRDMSQMTRLLLAEALAARKAKRRSA